MRPVTLEFCGLHSYRERQKIDFEELGRFGLFGIFGPTGSGKSSILDAITLALFGAVDRAPRKTYGIINQLESNAEISFTFELAGQRYTAQRRYERMKEDVENVKARYSRVIKHGRFPGSQDEVVAEGLTGCDEYIKELLGFGADDFLRAVVLPQGKFDQFLRLKPSERGAMLENIFGLEKFGEDLRVKAKKRVELHNNMLSRIEAAQLELGDCSDEALQAAEANIETIATQLQSAKEILIRAKSICEEQAELKKLYDELGLALKQQADLDSQKEHANLQSAKLELARKAIPLKSQIEQVFTAQKEVDKRKTCLCLLESRLQDAEKDYRQAKETLEAAESCEKERIPLLLQKKSRFEKAVQDKKELESVRATEMERKESLDKIDTVIKEKTVAEGDLKAQLSELSEKEKALTQKEADFHVDPSRREALDSAYYCYLDLKTCMDRLESIEKDVMKKKKALEVSRRRVLQVFRQIFDISASRYVFAGGGIVKTERQVVMDDLLPENIGAERFPVELRKRSYLSDEHIAYSLDDTFLDPVFWGGVAPSALLSRDDLLSIGESERDKAQAFLRKCQTQKEEALIREQASVLARGLREGEPCPVCGSLNHPQPCVSGDGEMTRMAQEAERLAADCFNAVQNWYIDLTKSVQSWDNAVQNHQELIFQSIVEYDQFLPVCNEFVQKAESVLGRDLLEEISARITRDGKARAYQLLAGPERLSVYEVLKPGMDEVDACVRAVTQKDKQMEMLRREIKDVSVHISNIQKQMQEISSSLSDLNVDRSSLAGYLEALGSQIQAIDKSIEEICGDKHPEEALEEVESEIRTIQDSHHMALKHEKAAQTALSDARLTHEKAKSAFEQAKTNLDSLSVSLSSQLGLAGFDTQEEAVQFMLLPEELEELQEDIRSYNEVSIEAQSKIKDLRTRIDSREFSEDAFTKAAAELEDAQSAEKRLTEEAAIAAKTLDDLTKARKRWEDLDSRRRKAEKDRDVANRLLSLISGRRFVQFLAEEHLKDMVGEASITLGTLTGQRYALELSDNAEFVIRDDFNGGERRSVTTLSGGETFLTSLALALALSSKIQLKGEYPLGFFFLDEGFGTLDSTKLDLVMDSLEHIQDKERMVGIISHVKELKDRLPSYLEVIPAKDDGTGSKIQALSRKKLTHAFR